MIFRGRPRMERKMKLFLPIVFFCSLFSNNKIIGVDGGRKTSEVKLIEIENELKLLNKPFVKTIKTKYGEIYDCVDFYKQPAFDHPLLKNHAFHPHMRPSSIPRMNGGKEFLKEDLESSLILIGCPVGTVPIRRTTKEDIIRAELHSEKYGSNNVKNLEHAAGNHYAIAKTKSDSPKKYIGAATQLSIWNPPVKSSQYSSSRIEVQNGQDYIQAGWTVNPTLYGHNKTHLFIYVNAGKLRCFNTRCPGFVIVNKDIPVDFLIEKTSTKDRWIGVRLLILLDTTDGNWWLHIGTTLSPIGFWPRQLFTDLTDMATAIEWGGEVFSPPNVPSPPMGTGEPKIIKHIGHASVCALLSTIEDGETSLKAIKDTELYKDNPHYDIQDIGFSWSGHGHSVMFGGSGGAIGY